MYRRHRTNVTSIMCPFNSNSPVCALRNDTRWSPVESRKKARDHTGLHRLWLPLMVWVGKLKCVKSNSCEFKAWQADFFEHDFNFLANYCNNSRSRTVWQGLAPTVEPEQQFSFSIHYFLRFQSKVKECFSWQFVLHTNKCIILSHLRKWCATGFLPVSISKWYCCWRDCGEDKWIISVFPSG